MSKEISVETSKQLSIHLENKPGRLANILSALAGDKVNIVAMTVMDSHENPVLRIVVDDPRRARSCVRELNMSPTETDVVVVELRNHPGALAHICEQLAGDHINIEYCYCSAGGKNGKTMGIFKVSNHDRAIRALSGNSRRKQIRPTPRDQRIYQRR
jgi:hypothetical protein